MKMQAVDQEIEGLYSNLGLGNQNFEPNNKLNTGSLNKKQNSTYSVIASNIKKDKLSMTNSVGKFKMSGNLF